jgi:hypothetical protein
MVGGRTIGDPATVSVRGPATFSHRRPVWAVLAGVGASTAGHVFAVLVFVLTLRYAYAGEDLEAGGLFAVAFLALVAFAIVEMILFTAALSVGIAMLQRNQRLGIGILAGWAGGLLIFAAVAVWVLYGP